MEKIYYDSYEKRIRITVWAEKTLDGSVRIHKYVKGIYIDDIGGTDEKDTVMIIAEKDLPCLFSAAHVSTEKELFACWLQFAGSRDGYELIKDWIKDMGVNYTEET